MDKPDTNAYATLSAKSLARRAKYNIPLNLEDRSVYAPYVKAVLDSTGGLLHHTSKWLNLAVILVNDSAQINPLNDEPFISQIRYVGYYPTGLHQNTFNKKSVATTLPKPWTSLQKAENNSLWHGATWPQTSIVHGEALQRLGYFGDSILIALLDEGYANVPQINGFDSMLRYGRVQDGYNFNQNDTNVYDHSLHGTYSLSNITGYEKNKYVGAAPKAQIALYVTEIRNSEQYLEMYNLLAASERADSIGADIITISLGYNQFVGPNQTDLSFSDIDGKTTVAAMAANIAVKKGIVFVASAGNEGGNSWNKILTPGDADSAITVGSVLNDKTPAGSSGFGPNAAGAIKPNVTLQGQPAAVYSTSSIITINGTSESTPQLAAWIACLLEARPNWTPAQIKDILQRSAHLYPSTHPQMGYGVPDFAKIVSEQNILSKVQSPITSPEFNVQVLGNPSKEGLVKILFNSEKTRDLQWAAYNSIGKRLAQGSLKIPLGSSIVDMDLPFSTGSYYLKFFAENFSEVKSITLLP